MNILVTGAKGMVGTALVNNLKNIRDNKNRTRPNISVEDIYEYDLDSTPEELDQYCQKADFVFNLAGVNRPENPEGDRGITAKKEARTRCVRASFASEITGWWRCGTPAGSP